MKKILIIAAIVIIVGIGAIVVAGNHGKRPGPAPNSGDGVPDGPGW
jgi:hypothetical protein